MQLRMRLQRMRELYATDDDDEDTPVATPIHDPFYDRFPWFRLVGRSYAQLNNLAARSDSQQSMTHRLSVVSDKGEVMAVMVVCIQPVVGNLHLYIVLYIVM